MLSLFRSKTKVPLIDFSRVGVDIHSHLIPGIDDGAQHLSQSVELVRNLVDLGFNKIITTPHVMVDNYRNTKETIFTGLAILTEELKRQGIEISIEAAAEYYLDEDFENKLNNDDVLTIGDEYLLFELPFSNYPINLFDIIEQIKSKGYKPLLAHPERYSYFHGSVANYYQFKDAGCYLQLNTISLTGYYNKSVQRAAEELVDNGLIDFVGSDMHHLKHANALKLSLQQPYVYKLLTEYPVLNHELIGFNSASIV